MPPTPSGRRDWGANLATARPKTQAARFRTGEVLPDLPHVEVIITGTRRPDFPHKEVLPGLPHVEVTMSAPGTGPMPVFPPEKYCRTPGGLPEAIKVAAPVRILMGTSTLMASGTSGSRRPDRTYPT